MLPSVNEPSNGQAGRLSTWVVSEQGERMPYYLVTQTSLVEAKDEVAAAEKVLVQLQEAREVTFTVRYDENTVQQVTVRRTGSPERVRPEPNVKEDEASSAAVGVVQQAPPSEPRPPTGSTAQPPVAAFAVFITGALVGMVAQWLML